MTAPISNHPTTLIARLPMYDWPATRAANDALWTRWRQSMAQRGLEETPAELDRSTGSETGAANLLAGQTCGITYVRTLRPAVSLIATPCYAAKGCDGPDYCSIIVVSRTSRADHLADLAGATAAINGRDSYSGWNALHATTGQGPAYFGAYVETGAHLGSAAAVAEGQADCAAIDAVSWALMARYEPELHGSLRGLCQSPPAPGLPLIAGPACDAHTVAILYDSLQETLGDPAMKEVLASLLLAGAVRLPPEEYDRLHLVA